jgi:poly-gamma-glutamate capsule biosynthesis protein CapA/YwtB (metallophosphatase superfamily)
MNPERRNVFRNMRGSSGGPDDGAQRPRRPVVTGNDPYAQARRPEPIRTPVQAAPERSEPAMGPIQPARPKTIKFGWLAAILVLFALIAGPAWFFMGRNKADAPGTNTGTQTAAIPKDTIRLLATGDFIAHDSVNAAAQKGDAYNYLPLMSDFPAIFKQADIRFCNDPILNGGKALGIAGYPYFNSPTEFVTDMGKLGCNLVNTASNHSFDFTQKNIDASVDAWNGVPNMLAVAGQNKSAAERDAVHTFSVKGVKMAFLAYTTYLNNTAEANDYGVNQFSEAFAARQIEEAKAQGVEFIIVSMRWGTEYSSEVTAKQRATSQWLSDQGVQLVLGHGPHVLQSVQQLTGSGGTKTTVWYSLGNFLNSQIPPETLFNGLAVMDIDIKTKELKHIRYLPIYMHYEWSADDAKAERTNNRTNLHLYLLENATQAMLDKQQLDTTVAAQKQRITDTLGGDGVSIPLITSKQLAD